MKKLIVLVAVALLLGSEAWQQPVPPAPLAGFSYSPVISFFAHRDPHADLAVLLDDTNPDLVRLPIYWESVEPTPDQLDFSEIDGLLAVVARHNESAPHPTRVVLTVGARNFVYPELHEPAWAGPRRQPFLSEMQAAPAYRSYFDASITRYRGSPLLYAWQVENEPFDYVVNASTGADQIDAAQLAWEIGEVHRLDPNHKAMTTTFDAWNVALDALQLYSKPAMQLVGAYPSGHPEETLEAGDALGLDMYIDGPSTPMRFTSTALRTTWKQQSLAFWSGRARSMGKEVWVSEMQAQPWRDLAGKFNEDDLISSATGYRQEHVQVVLLWGAETWLEHPAWMAAAARAIAILRSP